MHLKLAALGLLVATACKPPAPELPAPALEATPSPTAPTPPDPDAELSALAEAVRATMSGATAPDAMTLPPRLRGLPHPVHVTMLREGYPVARRWQAPTPEALTSWDLVATALDTSLARLVPGDAAQIDTIVIDVSYDYRSYAANDDAALSAFLAIDSHEIPRHMGVLGDHVAFDNHAELRAPSFAIATNRRLLKHLGLLSEAWNMTGERWPEAELSTFAADQFLIDLERGEATQMFRGNEVVDVASVDAKSVEEFVLLAGTWVISNMDANGRLAYHYFPSVGHDYTGDNAIRQWNASAALLRWAEHSQSTTLLTLSAQNLEHNLAFFFHFEDELGIIEYRDKVKLGALGLAGRALLAHPERLRWTKQIDALAETIDALSHPDGSFTSFYRGKAVEYWNFYPGEAMLFWAELHAHTKDPDLLVRYRRSFDFYRAWHLDPRNRNPAFVPWHLRANEVVLDTLAGSEPELEAELRAFMFEIADWLVPMQQWQGDPVHVDEWGRFYAPEQPWGVPHASSTGIYLWGLMSAYRVAVDAGDSARAQTYRRAIVRGLRALMQLQFVDEVDMYYVPAAERERVRGGLRTTVFDNRIRVDNVAYALATGIEVLDTFTDADYTLGASDTI